MKRQLRKIPVTLLALLILSVIGVFTASAENEGPYTYVIGDGEVTITDCDMSLEGDVIIPETLGGIPVTAIGDNAFFYCGGITSVTIGENIKSIGSMAFAFCGALSEVILPEDITQIEDQTFYMCFNLAEVNLSGTKVTSIGSNAFGYCDHLTHIALPDTVTVIEDGAFNWCSGLETVIIGKGVSTIGADAFGSCYNLRTAYYTGTADEFKSVQIGQGNERLSASYFYYEHIHVYDEKSLTRKATCLRDGAYTYTCRCGDSYSEYFKGEHSYKTATTKATASKNGKIIESCSLCGDIKKTTTIYMANSIKLSATAFTYDAKVKTPGVIIKNKAGTTLKEGTHYTLKYQSGRKNIGEYAVKITFKGSRYTGSKTLYFTINPAKTAKITATASTTSIKLTWSKVAGATGYRVYSYNPATKKYTALKTLSSTSYTVSKLSSGNEYTYCVKAYTNTGKKIIWGGNKLIETATNPAAVTLSSVTSANAGKAVLKWKQTPASGYQIYVSTSKNGTYKKVVTLSKSTTLSYTASSLKSGSTCYFKVRAYVKTGDGVHYGAFGNVKSVRIK